MKSIDRQNGFFPLRIRNRVNSPVAYILVALVLNSAMLSVIFFLAWKTQGRKPYALSWSLAFLAATAQWSSNLGAGLFPSFESYWLTVNAMGLGRICGHLQWRYTP
jgi:hypothetical protein